MLEPSSLLTCKGCKAGDTPRGGKAQAFASPGCCRSAKPTSGGGPSADYSAPACWSAPHIVQCGGKGRPARYGLTVSALQHLIAGPSILCEDRMLGWGVPCYHVVTSSLLLSHRLQPPGPSEHQLPRPGSDGSRQCQVPYPADCGWFQKLYGAS
jgi:hypothetical protein